MNIYKSGHRNMMDDLKQRGIDDPRVLKAMDAVPRHHFVPEPFKRQAYSLRPLPIGNHQTISTPFIVASMTQLLGLKGHELVLEIGTGCGYQTAILCELAASVYSIEIVPDVAKLGRDNLLSLGYKPKLKIGDGGFGWPDAGPFDAALIAATAPFVPKEIVEQLKVGGILLMPVEKGRHEVMVRCKRETDTVQMDELYGVRFVPMTGCIRGE